MNLDPADKRQPVTEIAFHYRMLLGEYCRDRKEVRKKENRAGFHLNKRPVAVRLKFTGTIGWRVINQEWAFDSPSRHHLAKHCVSQPF
jgi:hypothetical protein